MVWFMGSNTVEMLASSQMHILTLRIIIMANYINTKFRITYYILKSFLFVGYLI